ncbi:MAG: ABC transporter ATP-binding protein [Pseudomonadota bacterium]
MSATLSAHGLCFAFPGGFGLGPVDLDLGPGVHLLLGANGCGKTTLLRCLCGGSRPDRGRVAVEGRDPHREHAVRGRIAYVPAEPEIPRYLRVEEAWRTIAALRRARDWDGAALCRALGLPPGLLLDHASHGQRRKAELVAALAGDPPALLLDEPFAGLDEASVALLRSWIAGWAAERVVLLTTHGDPRVAVTSTATLERGQALAWGV